MDNNKDLNQTDIVNMMDMLAAFTIGPHGFSVQIEEDPKEVTFQCAVRRSALSSGLFSQYINRLLVAFNTRQAGCIKAVSAEQWQDLNAAYMNELELIITGIDALLNSSARDIARERQA